MTTRFKQLLLETTMLASAFFFMGTTLLLLTQFTEPMDWARIDLRNWILISLCLLLAIAVPVTNYIIETKRTTRKPLAAPGEKGIPNG
jgi:hypothetical protein